MKMRNKGKVHPSPTSSSSSSPSSSSSSDSLSVLKLLPAAILALISVLSAEDREVLAYLITRSLKSANPPSFLQPEKNPSKKSNNISHKKSSGGRANTHSNGGSKTPLFDCDCFDCYTGFWFRWDSSPNRELISHAIEAFEENLNLGEQSKKGGKNRKKDKVGRRGMEKKLDFPDPEVVDSGSGLSPAAQPEVEEVSSLIIEKLNGENEAALPPPSPEKVGESGFDRGSGGKIVESPEETVVERGGEPTTAAADSHHKGLARKVLPDVLGLLNSRLWNLWGPNV